MRQRVEPFFTPQGPPKLVFLYQPEERLDARGAWEPVGDPVLTLVDEASMGDARMAGASVYFVRVDPSKAITPDKPAGDIAVGMMRESALVTLRTMVNHLYHPAFKAQKSWKDLDGERGASSVEEFLGNVRRFGTVLNDAATSLEATTELAQPDPAYLREIELKPLAFKAAAENPAVLAHMDEKLTRWVESAESTIDDGVDAKSAAGGQENADPNAGSKRRKGHARESEDAGPDTELEYWRRRVGMLNSITEQLKSDGCRLVLGVTTAARSHAHRAWKGVDLRLTDAVNEAKDNVKYLTTLETSLEPMYIGTPAQVIDSLPSLINNVKMMHAVARYYGTKERMTKLFFKITNQMVTLCKEHVLEDGANVWAHDKVKLTSKLNGAVKLFEAYEAQYDKVRDQLKAQKPKPKQFDFDRETVFGKALTFTRRCKKLVDVVGTIGQFEELAKNKHIDGLEALLKTFFRAAEELKRKPYDPLDYRNNQFDRDYLDFNVSVHDLETSLQDFIDKSFENITSTEASLRLLTQFQLIMHRDALKRDLDAKYNIIFRNYGADLEAVMKTYEKHKHDPPKSRNAPPVAGDILWARQLLRRIEEPMRHFATNETIMKSPASRRVVKMYNKTATALMTFETLWHQAWTNGIERSKSGLRATLLVRHPQTDALLVNFDKEIMQLIREAKFMLRLDVDVPESARLVLAQEEKFKSYYNQLTHLIKEHERVVGEIPPVTKSLLAPHLADLDDALKPGLSSLTWTSTNIDAYLARAHAKMRQMELLVHKMCDLMQGRIDMNLRNASRVMLVDLPSDQSATPEEFVAMQNRVVKEGGAALVTCSEEIRRACDDLCALVAASLPGENEWGFSPEMDASAVAEVKAHFARVTYGAVLHATRKSFGALRRRVGSKAAGGFLFVERPFFEVTVELAVPHVVLAPSLEEIQGAVNGVAKKILRASLEIKRWGNTDLNGDEEDQPGVDYDAIGTGSFYDEIASDVEIVKLVLLLTGSVHGLRKEVEAHIATYQEYDFLYLEPYLAEVYADFVKTKPTLEQFEGEIKKYMDIERRVLTFSPTHNIGALSLETAPLKAELRKTAALWKTQFAANLHAHGKEKLDELVTYVKETTKWLNRPVEDLDDVRSVMAIQQDIREKEAEIDAIMVPIEQVYELLKKYEVPVPAEETEEVTSLKATWKTMSDLVVQTGENLQRLQAGFKRELLQQVKEFVADVEEFRADWDRNGPATPGIKPLDAVDRLETYKGYFDARKRKWKNYASGEELFGLPVTEYPELEKTEEELEFLSQLYDLYTLVMRTIDGYSDILWRDVVENIEGMTEQVNGFARSCRGLPKALKDWDAFSELKDKIDEFTRLLPLVQMLASPAMQPRHWQEIMEICDVELDMAEDTFKLRDIVEANLLPKESDIEDLAIGAGKEKKIEDKLTLIVAEWEKLPFVFVGFKKYEQMLLDPATTGELVEKLEESQMNLGSMATDRYSKPFEATVTDWNAKLATVSEVIEKWLVAQNMWVYMEAVFGGGDIVKQLPQEAKRFNQIDKAFVRMVQGSIENPTVVPVCCENEGIVALLDYLNDQLEMLQKSLTDFLDTKRALFPRFYFVSDPTLLEILSLGSEPSKVTKHFQSGLFDSVTKVSFDKDDPFKMLDMSSQQGEVVRFQREGPDGFLVDSEVTISGNIETWLQKLVDGMQSTIKCVIKHAHDEVQGIDEDKLEDFIFTQPAQIALLGIQFLWTSDMQHAIAEAKTDKAIRKKTMAKTDGYLKRMIAITTKDTLGKNDRKNLETCITVHVHQRDTSEALLVGDKRVKDVADFEWMKQCRFYWNKERETVIISICDVDFEYSYEYLGVKERLVITPLTDICYVTLSQALGMFLGGAPAGPAGTGKTETTKDLGNTLGKFVVVFNCSDQMDYKGMGKIYRGLAQSGLWGCFDEFNRINLDVLSVCAQQVFCVLSAIRERKSEFIFTDGAKVSLDPRVGFFITMNPGYAGRQELPENLKSLFRGVTMMVPNRQIIKKVKLAACGYEKNDFLGKKFFVLYGLCEQQLSKQKHYDFGLRNILSVLRTMGATKRANKDPKKSEEYLAMRTLRDMNMSKFVAEDVPLFKSLIGDIFPGMDADKAVFPEVEAAMRDVATRKGLQLHPSWLAKCVQLYETYQVRHGIMLVGPTGAGKTAIAETLAGALTQIGTKTNIWKMNPKAITAPQMFGRMDASTGDWTDGVFAVLWKRAVDEKKNHTWIVLDGPVDAIWIENLNTVLDDNKVLTLADGSRFQMTGEMKAMFEPENLNNASPATVSRAGIIYVSDSELGWRPLVDSWLATRENRAEAAFLKSLFDKYVDRLFQAIKMDMSPVMRGAPWEHVSRDFCQVTTLITMLRACLADASSESDSGEPRVERIFLYCLTWALGGMLTARDRPKLNDEMRKLSGDLAPRFEEDGDTFFEYFVSEDTMDWMHWATRVPAWEYPAAEEKPKFARLIIPTLDSVRLDRLLDLVTSVNEKALFVGGPGTAKTTVMKQFMARSDDEGAPAFTQKAITFSSLTTPQTFQLSVEASVEKRSGKTYGPPGQKKMIVFVDDISMPLMNDWGDQVTNEVVRQLLEQGGMYSLEKPIGDMKMIVDTIYLAAMNTPGGGKNDIPNRLKRHFAVFNVPLPSVAAINNIFGSLVKGRFAEDVFDEDVCDAAKKLVPVTIDLWNKVQAKMLPTPAKFHYLFNMRELSKVFQGIILAERDRFKRVPDSVARAPFGGNVTSPEAYLVALWRHECERVFCDKLTTHEDKRWGDELITRLITETFGKSVMKQVEERVYFVDFLREAVPDEETGEILDLYPSFYESAESLDAVAAVAMRKQELHNQNSKSLKLNLVLFEDALTHMMRIARLLCMDRGHALLVGVGGSGKQSLTRLAAYIAGAAPVQIQITKTYNVMNLFDDLKAMFRLAGLKGKEGKVAFIFTDADVKEESFLEYINQLLMTGEVAGLFPKDELDALVSDCRPAYKKEHGKDADTNDEVWDFFLGRVRDNLHMCLCFSPVGDKFAKRAQNFPGLINGCTIDWFLPWPQDALVAVSSKFIGDFEMACSDANKQSLQLHMGSVHVAVTKACREYFERFRRNVYVTPKSYLSFIDGYRGLYARKLADVQLLAKNINAGLSKMFEAKDSVKKMQVNLAEDNKKLAKAQADAAVLLKQISADTAVAEKEKEKVNVVVEKAVKQKEEIDVIAAEVAADLKAAEPMKQAAVDAVNSIKQEDIKKLSGIKGSNVPKAFCRTFDMVLILFQKPMSKVGWIEAEVKALGKGVMVMDMDGLENWNTQSLKLLADKLYEKMQNFESLNRKTNDETCEFLDAHFKSPSNAPEIASDAMGSLAGVINWCKAMKTYYNVMKVVGPKEVKMQEENDRLAKATAEKEAAEADLAKVQAGLDAQQALFDQAMTEKKKLEDAAAATQRKMDAASELITALAGEEVRWTEQSKQFDIQIQRLTGDCAMASSFVSYLGPFNKEFRDLLCARDFYGDLADRGIPVTENLDVTRFLVDDAEIGEWNIQGLPTDELSVQNGIMTTRATRYPVMVDPQGQGLTWIKNREGGDGLLVTTLNDKKFRTHLEDCMTYGRPLLIENIEEELDPLLDPILEKRIVRKGNKAMIVMSDGKEVDFEDEFKLFCTTRLPNPHYSPELSAKVLVIDFTVTMVGLEDQLLGKLILKEKNELEVQRQALVEEVNTYKKKIRDLEKALLDRLANATGDLLDDPELIGVLNNTKQTAQDVGEKLAVAAETNVKITEACEEYRPVAHRATLIYFLIAEFATCDVMYQTSLKQFNELYELAIDESEKAAMPAKRIANIIAHMTYAIYLYIQRGLFERHKLTFALMLTNKICVSAGTLSPELVNIFLKGGGSLDIKSVKKKPKEWIPDKAWLDVVALSQHPTFGDLMESMYVNEKLWRQWYDKDAPEAERVPDFEDRMDKFERMCLVKSLREDRTLVTAREFISEAIGAQFVESVPLNMENTWRESTPFVPLICLLSPGADPTKLIEELAKKKKIQTLGVSMGQGQEIIARRLMETATAEGQWVLLQNTHLGLTYMGEVETYLLKAENLHENFRLWITAEPHPQFPIGLLQMSIKITNEAPVGMRAGLRNSYAWVSQDMMDAVGIFEWRQMLFVMCYMHSIVQERRKFGPIGWNIRYEFNQSDLSACVQFLQNHLSEMDAKKLPSPTWDTVTYMVSKIQYGGRITDGFDELLMDTYATKFFNRGSLEKDLVLFQGSGSHERYAVPDAKNVEDFRKAIEALPSEDSPEIFGLHPNADLTFRTLQVKSLVETVVSTMPKSGGGGDGLSPAEIVDKIAEDLLSKVPASFEPEPTKALLAKRGANEPLTVHLRQEIDRLNIILDLCRATLANLRLAIAGTVALSGDLVDALDALFDAKIPPKWLDKSWQSATIGAWFQGLLQRHAQLTRWLERGRPKSYWMTGFFNPQGFLTAMKQEVNRKHKSEGWALDDVVMASKVTHPPQSVEKLKDEPKEGVYVHGLFLDGCSWDGKFERLVDSEPKKLYAALPVLHVTGKLAKDAKTEDKYEPYEAPTYRVKNRTGLNFIATFALRTEDPKEKWIMRGVALLCSVD